ncbi:calpain family cysteine protease [Xylariales sp. AK1849]|nr:calpain family cysteine protease [Xylariales sp. AK1849]
MEVFGDPLLPIVPSSDAKKRSKKTPQEVLSDFWDKFHTKRPGKVTSIFPQSLYQTILPPAHPAGARSSRNAAESYEAAAKECREKVKRIIRECNRSNEKFTDADFDIERDPENNCLNGLVRGGDDSAGFADSQPAVSPWRVKNSLETLAQSQVLGGNGTVPVDVGALGKYIGSDGDGGYYGGISGGECYSPGSIHRVDWIFESPQFTVNGYSSSDIKQGANGDCWWLAAVATIAHRKDLMEKVCVVRDEECGVYGFVFQREGEWVSTIVDDNLYLSETDFDHYGDVYDSTGKKARLHRKRNQTGSEALYFARCEDPNETWLPILEKAYAKVHGDYEAISGGWPGEAVEDMTGGVTTTVASNRVLSKDKLWKELVNGGGEFVFALAAMGTGWDWQRSGLALGHAYSILQSREEVDEDGNKVRLVQIRNPWGERLDNGVGEWNGPWSDGSREWTPYWLKKMDHKFGDDGLFWMSFKDMLDTFMFIHRTRLFDERWTVVQQWTAANVSWVTGYLQTKFQIEVNKAGLVVVVLTQLDDRFFRGFEGEYYFELHFLLQESNASGGEHICRVRPVHKWENRSVSCEVDLEPGKYEVLPKITATRNNGSKPVEEVVKEYAEKNPQKLRQVGMVYDLAHAKGGVPDEHELLEKRKVEEKKKKEAKKRKQKAKEKKAFSEAAKAMEKASDAMKEVVKNDQESTEDKKDEKTDKNPAGDKTATNEGVAETVGADTEKDEKPVEPPEPAVSSKPETAPSGTPASAPATESKPEGPSAPKIKDSKDAPPLPIDTEQSEAVSDLDVSREEEKKDEEEDEDVDSDEEKSDKDSDEQTSSPWNAVAVIGLRVYARDPEVTITLVKAANAEEATSLTVDGKPAGATT